MNNEAMRRAQAEEVIYRAKLMESVLSGEQRPYQISPTNNDGPLSPVQMEAYHTKAAEQYAHTPEGQRQQLIDVLTTSQAEAYCVSGIIDNPNGERGIYVAIVDRIGGSFYCLMIIATPTPDGGWEFSDPSWMEHFDIPKVQEFEETIVLGGW